MSKDIHPTAIVSPKAYIEENVTIGPFVIIGENVKIGAGTKIDAFAQVLGNTEIGKNCHIFSYAIIGNITQDLKYKGEKSYLIIGDNNKIREFVTIHPGTEGGSKTIVGNNNLFMVYSHIAHDCKIGDNNIFANAATLAGYVTVENNAVIGGLAAIHQFCRIGSFSIVGGCSKVVQDVPPYSMCDGHPAVVKSINVVGLRRANFSSQKIQLIKKAFKILFFQKHPFNVAKKIIEEELPSSEEISYLLDFISSSKRGICL
ncbi:MAG: acyl-ACP--UDP-N-acetylglucosamine O-acyltransferase [Candidatus Omnitrophica bacterium]|nr:acyl-ACP--UDP-N-acetylglucosamine O-acyltransferase [Candidatus Omnitrophota bacterium]